MDDERASAARRIEALVNEAIEQEQNRRPRVGEPINWADLKCVEVEYVERLLGWPQMTWRVYVEEAAPTCELFCHFLSKRLEQQGFDVEVVTQW